MGSSARCSDFSGALSAMVVGALLVATTTLMLVTFQAARAGHDQVATAADTSLAQWRTVTLADRR